MSPETVSPDAVGDGALEVKIGSQHVNTNLGDLKMSLDKALAKASELLTLKMGDIVFLSATEPLKPQIGDSVEVTLNGIKLLDFEVK